MANFPGNGTAVVQAGDNMWTISKQLLIYEGTSNPTDTQIANKSNWLVSLNKLKNANLIHPGQVLKTCTTTTTNSSLSIVSNGAGTGSNSAVIESIGFQSGTDRTLFVTWTWSKHDTTKEYKFEWYYDTGDSLEWFHHSSGSTKYMHTTWAPPENAKRVKFMVQPIANTKEAK